MRPARLPLLAVLAGGACAQDFSTRIDCSRLDAMLSRAREAGLEAYVEPIRPRLGYALRFQAGYLIVLPLMQFRRAGEVVGVTARVAPVDGTRPPVCFGENVTLGPEYAPGGKGGLTITGGFFLGAGQYRVDLAVFDDSARVFRKRLTLTAAPHVRERHLKLRLEPGTVQPIQELGWTPRPSHPDGAPRRLTILLHAASLYGPRTRLTIFDQMQLLSSLSTVLSESAFDEVRVIAFNLDLQRELFRQDRFDVDGFRQLAKTLLSLKLYHVTADAVKTKAQSLDMLAALVRAERSAGKPPDAIVFLGPSIEDESKWRNPPCEPGEPGPPLFYFEHRVDWRLEDSGPVKIPVRPLEFPDTLERLVHACSGEAYRIHNPAELASAIAKLNGHVQ